MISEETLMFSGFDENRLEYCRNVLFLIILKGIASLLIDGVRCI
jgi:hypothetical protein